MKVKISDGHSFITKDINNRYSLTTDPNKALVMDKISAEKVIKNSLRNTRIWAKKNWFTTDVTSETDSSEEALQTEPDKYRCMSECELLHLIEEALEAYCELESRESNLLQKSYDDDKRREDLVHTIENVNFNAYQGFCLCRGFQDILRQRRILKKSLAKMKAIQESGLFHDITKLQKLITDLKRIELADRYHYRIIEDYGDSVRLGQSYQELVSNK